MIFNYATEKVRFQIEQYTHSIKFSESRNSDNTSSLKK